LDIAGIEEINPRWATKITTALNKAGLLDLCCLDDTAPPCALLEFWASFCFNKRRMMNSNKCIKYHLGGEEYHLTIDEFADELGLPRQLPRTTRGMIRDKDLPRKYWRKLVGDDNAVFNTASAFYQQVRDPMSRFLHLVSRDGLAHCLRDQESDHRISKVELIFLIAIRYKRLLHPRWVVAQFFHRRRKRQMCTLPGGQFIGRIIANRNMQDAWSDLSSPYYIHLRLNRIGPDILRRFSINLDEEATEPSDIPRPRRTQVLNTVSLRDMSPDAPAEEPAPHLSIMSADAIWTTRFDARMEARDRFMAQHQEEQIRRDELEQRDWHFHAQQGTMPPFFPPPGPGQ
ncbi:hypothetical protein LINGRAHAP2_LOCUS5072, partial [Linum grandiflorum]